MSLFAFQLSEALLYGAWILGQSLAFAPNFGQAKLSAARIFQLLDRVPTQTSGGISKANDWKTDGNISYSRVRFLKCGQLRSNNLNKLPFLFIKLVRLGSTRGAAIVIS